LIEHGYGAIVIDAKGDELLQDELERAAVRADRRVYEWTPEGPTVYNAPARVVRLFATPRSAHLSMLLGTQELADLRPAEHPQLAEQVIGNLATVIAHRRNMPASAETIAEIAGTRGAWITTQKTNHFMVPSQLAPGPEDASSASTQIASRTCRRGQPQ
jgi:hypothetical protein